MTWNDNARDSETLCSATTYSRWLLFAIVLPLAFEIPPVRAAVEDLKNLEGAWMLRRQSEEQGEWATVELQVQDHKLTIKQLDVPLLVGLIPVWGYAGHSERELVLLLTNGFTDLVFKAVLSGVGNPQRIEGPNRLQSQLFPFAPTWMARLERLPKYRKVDMKTNGRAAENTGGLGESLAFLAAARKAVAEYSDLRYAPLDLKIAQAARRDLRDDATTEERAWAESRLLQAARQSGRVDLVRNAELRLEPLKRLLAGEKKGEVEPLKPDPYPGRANARHDRVVLLELFTGAECGPCVAADLAFDALSDAYRSTELITLEYHLHIPRPDPLTGGDSVARAAFYDIHSTPSTVFNGKPAAGSGGPIEDARKKLNQYRYVIDEDLKNAKRAAIKLEARKTGDQIRIAASAEILKKADEKPIESPRLLLVLVEENVAYQGGNGQSSHHHVVRAFPAGVEGTPLESGKGRIETTVSLDKLRADQTAYLKAYPDSPKSRGKFPRALPTIALDHLSVVAIVQDAHDRSILHVAVVPVDEPNGSKENESGKHRAVGAGR
jgi:hypothetical protein